MDAHDLRKTIEIRFYTKEMIYKACVDFRNLLIEMVDEGFVPVDISVNVTHPSEFDIEKFTPATVTDEEA